MSGPEPAVALRPAAPDDAAFLARVYASTREDLALLPLGDADRAALVAQQLAAQTAHYAHHHAGADHAVVVVDGEPAGRLIVARRADEIRIVDIALLPAFRSRGIGTRLLAPLLAEATARGVELTLHVARGNPAVRLYERLGFLPVGGDDVHLALSRAPAVGAAGA